MAKDKDKFSEEGLTVREACRNRRPIDGSDAQSLEHALSQVEQELEKERAFLFRGKLRKLFELADDKSCDGNCDEKYPHKKCPSCNARSVINDIGGILREALEYKETNDGEL